MKRLIAALSFFTRLPFWRLATLDRSHYERVVPLWPVAGWITGAVMATVYYLGSLCLPVSVCIILALISRVLVTGALHEDGFADFCDGFGGATTRERTLEIMKDSHIGTYGVLGLILYYLLSFNILYGLSSCLPVELFCLLLLTTDAMSKYLSSSIVWFLPYARTASEAKNRLVYTHTSTADKVVGCIFGPIPFCLLAWQSGNISLMAVPVILCSVLAVLFSYMRSRIGGYTGDCCGATFVITETLSHLILLCILSL